MDIVCSLPSWLLEGVRLSLTRGEIRSLLSSLNELFSFSIDDSSFSLSTLAICLALYKTTYFLDSAAVGSE